MADDRFHHDLKNELGIVLGFSQVLLAEMDVNDPLRADVLEIHAAAQRAMTLLQQPARDRTASDAAQSDPVS